MTEPTCFTVAELAARWKCGKRAVLSAIKAGKLQAFRVGPEYRVRTNEARRYEGEEEGKHDTDEDKALAAFD